MEYYCQYCRDYFEFDTCEAHFESSHGQSNVTIEKLKTRLECLGAWMTRDPEEIKEENKDKKPTYFVTNNFRHLID